MSFLVIYERMMIMSTPLYEAAIQALKKREVTLDHIADLVLFLQKKYYPNLTKQECQYNICRVLDKREVQNTILTAVELDILAENNQLTEPVQTIIYSDDGLYGVDETLALSIIHIYGSIGFTNFGHLDKEKPGILSHLNAHKNGACHTFLDDVVGAIAAAAASRLAHSIAEKKED